MGSHQEAFCGGKSLNRLREEMFPYHSMQLAGIVFQVDYNAHVIESILKYVAPELGWR
jgi:hypothetical protein